MPRPHLHQLPLHIAFRSFVDVGLNCGPSRNRCRPNSRTWSKIKDPNGEPLAVRMPGDGNRRKIMLRDEVGRDFARRRAVNANYVEPVGDIYACKRSLEQDLRAIWGPARKISERCDL